MKLKNQLVSDWTKRDTLARMDVKGPGSVGDYVPDIYKELVENLL